MPLGSQLELKCAVCQESSLKTCSRCKIQFYCSEEHQKQDWKQHKFACLAPAAPLPDVVKTRAEAERDKDDRFVIDAILLPHDSDTPRFVKVVCEMYGQEFDAPDPDFPELDGRRHHRALLDPYLGANAMRESTDISNWGGFDGPPLGYTLMMSWRDMFMQDGSPLNRCVVKLTNGKAYHPWGGNLIAYRVDEPTHRVARCQDAKAEDLKVLVAYLLDYGERMRE
ncbi:hypothetical protein R3P38DRAFT_1634030 [Favolaschia claudopus]|uniref:MYND-type domain-containing protein n=1 Tax=Favolaschia claudopus TaxID=2862362 RepID=A0AAW0DL36_9AGAR